MAVQVKKAEMFEPTYITASNLQEAWFLSNKACMQHGYRRPVLLGARQEQERKELDFLYLRIKRPWEKPLIPDTAPKGVPLPTDMNYVYKYLNYIATPDKTEEEEYTYGERTYELIDPNMIEHDKQEGRNIHADVPQFEYVANLLKKAPGTNRAIVMVGKAQDLTLRHPPCLRLMHFKIRKGQLHLAMYFRSWDIYAGLPCNLAAYQMFKQSMLNDLNDHYAKNNMPLVRDGEIIATSLGAHVYSGQWAYAATIIGECKTIEEARAKYPVVVQKH